MRRVFIIRKDLNLKPGKLAAMVGHFAEAYWTNLLKNSPQGFQAIPLGSETEVVRRVFIPKDIWEEYVNGIFTKTICECRNLEQLKTKAIPVIQELQLVEGRDWGWINDHCKTDLVPENEDGTTTIGIWVKPLKDDDAHMISRKFKLYGAFDI